MNHIISYLFETNAFRVCPENKPFWYTSGKIGPYFINTHFLYGNETEATEFLNYIDEVMEDKIGSPKKIFEKAFHQFETNDIYHYVIMQMKEYIQKHIPVDEVDYISGGERRDWFFSNLLAHLLGKPHITLFKDLSAFVSDANFKETIPLEDLTDKKVLHIADLITVASSYIKLWIPAIENLNGKVLWSTVVVDRMQGGQKILAKAGVISHSLIQIDENLFDEALNMDIINDTQYQMLNNFYQNPDETMKNFLINHPEFLENALHSDEKTAKRAKLCIDNNLYNL